MPLPGVTGSDMRLFLEQIYFPTCLTVPFSKARERCSSGGPRPKKELLHPGSPRVPLINCSRLT